MGRVGIRGDGEIGNIDHRVECEAVVRLGEWQSAGHPAVSWAPPPLRVLCGF